jgi:hypothetical protein
MPDLRDLTKVRMVETERKASRSARSTAENLKLFFSVNRATLETVRDRGCRGRSGVAARRMDSAGYWHEPRPAGAKIVIAAQSAY